MSTLDQKLEAVTARVAALELTAAETAAATGAGTMTHKAFFDLFTMAERLRWRDLIDTAAQTTVAAGRQNRRCSLCPMTISFGRAVYGSMINRPSPGSCICAHGACWMMTHG